MNDKLLPWEGSIEETARQKAIGELKKWQGNTDKEIAHSEADDILCAFLISLGYKDVVSEWEKIEKWYA